MTTATKQEAEIAFKTRTKEFWGESTRPVAWALGIATYRDNGEGEVPTVLAVEFINFNFNPESVSPLFGNKEELERVKLNEGSLAAIFMGAGGLDEYPGAGSFPLTQRDIKASLSALYPYTDEEVEKHPNINALWELAGLQGNVHLLDGYTVEPVLCCIDDLGDPPKDAVDAYLRLHLLSARYIQPHGANLDGLFGLLENNIWTNYGPIASKEDLAMLKRIVRMRNSHGQLVSTSSVDRFPRMTDYVIPSGVRIADADRVRLGAHLADGTVVMHEGFVNFNAGTLGASMVEGRISAGVVVEDGTDIGGGASIMGTLSGGGKEVIRIGEGCLLGANSGLGISLGNNCVVEAGLYLTAGTIVGYLPDGLGGERIEVKARELSDYNDLLFLRHSVTGAVEARVRATKAVELNKVLHDND